MRAVIVKGRNQLEIRDIGVPVVSTYDCLVKIDACAICTGTDSGLIDGSFSFSPEYPFILGHESTGIIVEKGERVKQFSIGQRVTRPSAVLFDDSEGGFNSGWGGFAEYGLVRDVGSASEDGITSNPMLLLSRYVLPNDVDSISAALSINQREIISIVNKLNLEADFRTVVVGSGYNGFLFSLFLKYFGAGLVIQVGNPVFSDLAISKFFVDDYINYHDPELVSSCRTKLGSAPTHVIDAVGSIASLSFCNELLSPNTKFGCYGLDDFDQTTLLRDAISLSHQILPMETDEAGVVKQWYELWKGGFFQQINVLTKVMPIDQINDALDILANRKVIKIVLRI